MTRYVDSYYAATRREVFTCDPFEDGRRFDVAIVGGGLTGLNAALELAQRGIRPCVLEQQSIGWGASGRSGGQVIAGVGCDMTWLEGILGLDRARQLWDMAMEGMADVRRRIKHYRIDCDLTDGHLVVAHNSREAARLCRSVDHLCTRYDYPVRFLDRNALVDELVSPVYHGALHDPGSGHLHPLNYTLGVARLAQEAGAVVCEGVAVTGIEGGGPYRVRCDAGEIQCENVLLCVNAYLDRLAPSLARHFIPVGSHIVATRALGEDQANALIPGRAAVADTRHILDYYRFSADYRLLFGGRVGLFEPSREDLKTVFRRRIARVFPELAGVEIDYAWGGHVAVTRSHAPHLGQLRDGIFFAHGYTGHGMVLSGIAGKLLAEAVSGDATRLRRFAAIPNPAIVLPRALLRPALAIMLTWFRLLDRM
jgi:gamma-glutamylputrescine oxidase